MASLVEQINAFLQNELSLEELVGAVELTQRELDQHRSQLESMLAGVPDSLVAPERDAWQASFGEVYDRLQSLQQNLSDRAALRQAALELPSLFEGLATEGARTQEAVWSALGPSSHPGANELLRLLERLEDGDEQVEEPLLARLELEMERLDHQREALEELPEFAAEALGELLDEFSDWLQRCLSEPNDWGEMAEELFDWSLVYASMDLDFLTRRYSGTPTALPDVNLALNCQRLWLEELVPQEVLDWAVEEGLASVSEGSQQFAEEHSLSDSQQHALNEVSEQLLGQLESLSDVDTIDALKEFGSAVSMLVERLVSIFRSAEGEAGGRLNYRSS